MDFFLITLYRFVFAPLGLLLAAIALPFSRKLRLGLTIRIYSRIRNQAVRFNGSPIWIHCSSGEFEYAKPLIREIKATTPTQEILVTYFSPSYQKAIETFPGVDAALPLPLDLPGPVFSFLLRFRPKLLLIARTDLWPELLYQARTRKIPRILFSCTKEKISLTDKILGPIKSWPFKLLTEIHTATVKDQEILKAWLKNNNNIFSTGDTRFDQVIERLAKPKALKDLSIDRSIPCLVAGSTWPEDERVLLDACSILLKERRLQLILVPHEPTSSHLKDLEQHIAKAGLSSLRYSSATTWNGKDILLVDQIGILADLYKWGDLALIGGSFKSSVHSVMEALASGLWTLVGPFHHNNREAIDFSKLPANSKLKIVAEVKTASIMKTQIEEYLNLTTQTKAEIRDKIKAEVLGRTGASQKLYQHLINKSFLT